jgi:acetyl-CoA C-acetyltransferase
VIADERAGSGDERLRNDGCSDMKRDPHVPVIIGVGFHQERTEDPRDCSEPYQLMVRAVRRAAEDAGSDALLAQLESISVPQGMWQYRNPGRLIADALGCGSARSIIADLGVLQLTLLSDLCRRIAAGEETLGVVTGGEAQYRELRSMISRHPVSDTRQPEDTPPPDVHLTSADPFCSDLEGQRGLHLPAELFAIIESALRHAQGLGIEEHRDRVARLYSDFSTIAAANPHAWRREPMSAEEIRNPTGRNAMLAFPYTKRHCSQWNVNQGVAILVCSLARAEQLGLRRDGWIYPLAGVESKHVVVMAQQRWLYSHPGTVLCGERALSLAGVTTGDLTAAELYSCFPAAIQSFAHDLRLLPTCPLTVTGAMPFAGGPFNHFSLEGVARMVEVLRARDGMNASARRIGLVSNLSGIFGKQGCALFSNVPAAGGYRYEDVTAIAAERDIAVPLDGDYAGPATIAGYTVMFNGQEVSHCIAVCDTPQGTRTVVRSEERELLERMIREEFCGRTVEVRRDGSCSLADATRILG